MSSSTVLKLNTLPAPEGTSIAAALGEVAVAFQHLASALVRTAFSPAAASTPVLSAYEEAEALRSYAAGFQTHDPDFAQDLFAAADRHEMEAAAATATATVS